VGARIEIHMASWSINTGDSGVVLDCVPSKGFEQESLVSASSLVVGNIGGTLWHGNVSRTVARAWVDLLRLSLSGKRS
jgi:hypothetical protein